MAQSWLEGNSYYKYLLSDANIYLAVYSVESYVFEDELLQKEDKERLYRLKDKFNEEEIQKNIIPEIRKELQRLLLNKNEYIWTQVYFEPKKYEKDKMEFRPLHTTGLISQMAIVAMLNLLIYETPKNITQQEECQLRLSNISRLIPSNFYGNRVSLKPKELFKPWREQYQKYSSRTNEYLQQYHTSLEYKYEVTLDLQKFFPSVNPAFLYQFILKRLPVVLTEEDRAFFKVLLKKLLYCKVGNLKREKLWNLYYFDDAENTGSKAWKEFNGFTKGVPQGLPQSYFMGNIAMIPIAERFAEQFPGKSLFYVDDSVIFTNEVEESVFQEKLQRLNESLDDMIEQALKKTDSYLSDPLRPIYKLKVHTEGKSYYTRLDQAEDGEIFLMCLSREASHAANDLRRLYSEEEDNILLQRMKMLSGQIEEKIRELSQKLEALEKKPLSEEEREERDRYKKFIDRLVRYHKFFYYRYIRMELMQNKSLEELEKIIYEQEGTEAFLEKFVSAYKKDIWLAAVGMYYDRETDEQKRQRLSDYIQRINKDLFGFKNIDSSYLYQVYAEKWDVDKRPQYGHVEVYGSLRKMTEDKLSQYYQKHSEIVERFIEESLYHQSKDEIMKAILPCGLHDCQRIVNANTDELFRMVLNAICSYLFSVEMDDSFVIRKKNRKPLNYGELRILLLVRNFLFTERAFQSLSISLSEYENQQSVDYSIMEVTEVFRAFVKEPLPIDNLIRTHQYICDIWKNGSKYLYFYTLHNQEHAIALIKNVIKLIHVFSHFQISRLDYYIVFLSCYLHDIAMVNIPTPGGFLLEKEDADPIALKLQKEISEKQNGEEWDGTALKKMLVEIHQIVDVFFENQVRKHHGKNSAKEIRNTEELDYLDQCLREFVAEVAAAHVHNTKDIYFVKSTASNRQVSLKYDKILLRLADALDISMYRISRPILHHNLDQMKPESAFHWISHLLIQGYRFEMECIQNEEKALLTPGSVTEKAVLKVFVKMSQLSKFDTGTDCDFVGLDKESLDGNKNSFDLVCGKSCKDKESCNFLCRWFVEKNSDLLCELDALNQYLKRAQNFFDSSIVVRIEMVESTAISAEQFDLVRKYLEQRRK
ncbi:MAG: hypothetical protein HFI39_06040 [Lachnospiraceae bacterium]|nr:hypothetical protein [Lachnospiraceae bacterium]